jgi:hypothetical protein
MFYLNPSQDDYDVFLRHCPLSSQYNVSKYLRFVVLGILDNVGLQRGRMFYDWIICNNSAFDWLCMGAILKGQKNWRYFF